MKIKDLEQRKLDSTRRIHVFEKGADFSLCGFALWDNSYKVNSTLSWKHLNILHPTDDLNYCQRCGQLMRKP